MIVVEDAETGEQLTVDSSDAEFRHRLREAGEAPRGGAARADARAPASTSTRSRPTDDLVQALVRIVESREAAAALMSLGSPWMLLWLACVPGLVLAYWWALRRRAERVGRLASEGLVPTASSRRVRWRRHVPFALFAAALALVCFALARPTVSLALPEREGTVILAFDVSNSMRAKDLEPTRIEAAKAAATAFVEQQPDTIRIGVVAFGDGAVTVLQAEQREGGRDRRDQAPLGERRHVARPGPLHVAQRDRGEAADDRRVGARQRRRQPSTSASSARRRSCCSPTARTRRAPTR